MTFKTQEIVDKLSKQNSFVVILILSVFALFAKVPFIIATEGFLNIMGLGDVSLFSSNMQIPQITRVDFILGVIVAPVLETLIAQTIPIKIGQKLKLKSGVIILFSALLFGLMHLPVLAFVPGAIVVGIVLALNYLIEQKKGGGSRAFISTTLVHALHNLYAFLITWYIAGYSS